MPRGREKAVRRSCGVSYLIGGGAFLLLLLVGVVFWRARRKIFGVPSPDEQRLADPKRLADVMALIQVLAFNQTTHHSEKMLQDLLRRDVMDNKSRSRKSWEEVAQEHPGFFRVNPAKEDERSVSQIARHASLKQRPHSEGGGRARFTTKFVHDLLSSTVEIHDRQVRRSERWRYLVPIWVALVTGIFTLLAVGLRVFRHCIICSEELGVGLVVVGSRGLNPMRRALMGSVSDSVVRHAHYPVMVVRKEKTLK